MAAKTAGDVLDELTARGLAGENEAAAKSYISQAADEIRGYCGLPEEFPSGRTVLRVGGGVLAADRVGRFRRGGRCGCRRGLLDHRGDTTIQFGGSSQGAGAGGAGWALDGCRAVLNRYRRMAW